MSNEPNTEQSVQTKRYFSPIGRAMLIIFLILMLGIFLAFWIRNTQKPEQVRVLTIDGKPVYINEAMVYYHFIRDDFEDLGGEDVWSLEILGVDVEQTALDRTLASIVRVKTARAAMPEPTADEREQIEAAAAALKAHLGQDYRMRHDIDDDLIYQVAEDNYLAYQYEHNARFLYSEIEDDIQSGMAQRFGRYDNTRTMNEYLERVILTPIMFYTGTFVEGQWTAYPQVQTEQILRKAEAVRDALTEENFRLMGEEFGDSVTISDDPVFTEGVVRCPEERFGQVYRGQIEPATAEMIFSYGIGEISPILETPYGYLIVWISGYRGPMERDREAYDQQLAYAKTLYRSELTEDLKARRLSQELDRLVEGSEIVLYEDVFAEYVRMRD